jgi:hypothetical protein
MPYSNLPDNQAELSVSEKASVLYFCSTSICSYSEHKEELQHLFSITDADGNLPDKRVRRRHIRAYRRRGHAALLVVLTATASAVTILQHVIT